MPPLNESRRNALADAAIELLVETGVHGVTHRAAERRAGLPAGTASNYFRSREALLIAAARRVVQLHQRDMEDAAAREASAAPRHGQSVGEVAAELIAQSLRAAATVHRDRYLAIFELRLESLRRPVLAEALAGIEAGSIAFTASHHRDLELAIPESAVPAMVGLYGGALFTLVTAPPGSVSAAGIDRLARSVVSGALAGDDL